LCGYIGDAIREVQSINGEEGVVIAAAKATTAVAAMWSAFHGLARNHSETFEQRTVRRWLQGKE
jgi:hypothetical protein